MSFRNKEECNHYHKVNEHENASVEVVCTAINGEIVENDDREDDKEDFQDGEDHNERADRAHVVVDGREDNHHRNLDECYLNGHSSSNFHRQLDVSLKREEHCIHEF